MVVVFDHVQQTEVTNFHISPDSTWPVTP